MNLPVNGCILLYTSNQDLVAIVFVIYCDFGKHVFPSVPSSSQLRTDIFLCMLSMPNLNPCAQLFASL